MRCISFGPGADADESSESQVLASGPTLDSLASFDAFAAVDAGAPEGGWGAPGSNVLEGTVDSCDALDSDQAPNLMHLIHRSWHPGLSMQTPSPMQVPLSLMKLMDRMHLKSWPWGRLSIH